MKARELIKIGGVIGIPITTPNKIEKKIKTYSKVLYHI